MPRKYPAEFRQRAISLVRSGQSVPKTASDFDITNACLYNWLKLDRIDRGEIPGTTTVESQSSARPAGASASSRTRWRFFGGPTPCSAVRLVTQKGPPGDRCPRRGRVLRPTLLPGPRCLESGLPRLSPTSALADEDAAGVVGGPDSRGPRRLPRHLWRTAGPRRAHPGPGHPREPGAGYNSHTRRRDRRAPRPCQGQTDQGDTDLRRPRRAEVRPSALDELWVTDITEHRMREGKVYCCGVMDTCSRRIVGWSIDSIQDTQLVVNALDMAIKQRRAKRGSIVHADHGVLQPPSPSARTRSSPPLNSSSPSLQDSTRWQHDHSQPVSTERAADPGAVIQGTHPRLEAACFDR